MCAQRETLSRAPLPNLVVAQNITTTSVSIVTRIPPCVSLSPQSYLPSVCPCAQTSLIRTPITELGFTLT